MKYRSYQYRLKPTANQRQKLESFGSATRFIWNYFLEQNKQTYRQTKKFIFKSDMINQIPELKQEHEWLKEIPSQSLQQKCWDLDTAIKNCYKRKFGFPKFKSKKWQTDSFRIPQQIANGKDPHIKVTKKQIKIPKLGWVKWVRHRPLQGRIKSITIKQIANNWYVSVLCEQKDDIVLDQFNQDQVIGLDFGLMCFITDSHGNKTKNPKIYRSKQKKLKRQQRKLSRCSKSSNRRNKQRKKVVKIHRDIANLRKDFLHKLSRTIAKSALIVGVEDLNIKGIGRNKHLSKSVFDSGWGFFTRCLDYKLKEVGGQLLRIDRFYPSTKTCSSCGQTKDIPLNIRIYECDCGMNMDRDMNAAINIRREAINQTNRAGTVRIQARGDTSGGEVARDTSSHVSMNREKFRVNMDSEAVCSLDAQ